MKPIILITSLCILMICHTEATVLNIYPAANGYAAEASDNQYAIIRADAGDDSGNASTTTVSAPYLIATNTIADNMSKMSRGIMSFDTSSIPDTANITGATLHVYISAIGTDLGTPEYGITGGELANNVTVANGDYNGFTNVRYASDVAVASSGRYWNWTLNAAGIANISKTAFMIIYLRDEWDIDNSFGGVWGSTLTAFITWRPVGYATESQRPYLEIEYSDATTPVASFTKSRPVVRIPQSVTMTDTSTNTPTAWQWSWGDGTANATTQNPSHTYKRPGYYTITLTSSNAAGQTAATSRIRVYDAFSPYRLTFPSETCFDLSSLSFSREVTEYERTMTIERIKALC